MGTDQLKELKRLQKENERLRKRRVGSDAGQAHPVGGRTGKLLSPARRRACIDHVRSSSDISSDGPAECWASIVRRRGSCRGAVLTKTGLVADMIELARQYGRYGYRRIAALLRDAGWQVNDKRVERLWRREGLKVPTKQPKKGRLWLNDGSCVRLRPEYRDHVWCYDFVHCRTDDGKAFRTLNILDEYSRECLAIRVKRKLNSTERDRCPDRPVHPARRASLHPVRQRPRVHCSGRPGTGLQPSVPRRPTSSQDHPGRTDTAKASMPASGMSC